jgi:hypothetical protein
LVEETGVHKNARSIPLQFSDWKANITDVGKNLIDGTSTYMLLYRFPDRDLYIE